MLELNDKLELFSYLMTNGPLKRSQAIGIFNVSSRTLDRYTSALLDKHFIVKDIDRRDPIYSVNWDYFDILSHQKKPEYRKGNTNDLFDDLE